MVKHWTQQQATVKLLSCCWNQQAAAWLTCNRCLLLITPPCQRQDAHANTDAVALARSTARFSGIITLSTPSASAESSAVTSGSVCSQILFRSVAPPLWEFPRGASALITFCNKLFSRHDCLFCFAAAFRNLQDSILIVTIRGIYCKGGWNGILIGNNLRETQIISRC